MALEQPFSTWPFNIFDGNRPTEGTQTRDGQFRYYDGNESPFKDISPIPNGGREANHNPPLDRQPSSYARERLEHALQDQTMQEPSRQPERGLTLMDRYRNAVPDERPIRRVNSFPDFDQLERNRGIPDNFIPPFVIQPNHARSTYIKNQTRPVAPRENDPIPDFDQLERNRGIPDNSIPPFVIHPNQTRSTYIQNQTSPVAPRDNNSIPDFDQMERNRWIPNKSNPPFVIHPNPTDLNNTRSTRIENRTRPFEPRVKAYASTHTNPYRRRKNIRNSRRKRKNALYASVCLLGVGVLILVVFIAAFVAVTIVYNAWPTSGLLLAGVVAAVLMILVGCFFLCYRCTDDVRSDDFALSRTQISPPITDSREMEFRPVWQNSFQMSTLNRTEPIAEYPRLSSRFSNRRNQEVLPTNGVAGGVPNGAASTLREGVPTPLTNTQPFPQTLNDYTLY